MSPTQVPVIVYTTRVCPYCVQAKKLLGDLGISYEEIGLDQKPELRQKLSEENQGYRTVPMIFIEGRFVGGYTDLINLHRQKGLDHLINVIQ